MNIREVLFPKLFTSQQSEDFLKVISQIPANAFTNAAPLARKNGPATSKAAAEALTKSGARDTAKGRVLALFSNPLRSQNLYTAHELSSTTVIPHSTIHKRLPDLRRDGLVENGPARVCAVTGRASLTWKAKA